jgi:hypothetical protein
MARFICAVHAENRTPRAYALVEQMPGPDGVVYRVDRLHRLDGDDPHGALADALAAEPQYAGATTVVTTGGQPAADALHATGPSAVAVHLLRGRPGDADALSVTEQVLVDTFEGLYRARAVDLPGVLDEASGVLAALYREADLEAAAPDGDRDAEGDLDDEGVGSGGAAPDTVEQSGGETAVSTGVVTRGRNTELLAAEAEDRPRLGRLAAATGVAPRDLGEPRAPALALALACWYGEFAADELPTTDMADEAARSRMKRRNPAKPTGTPRPGYVRAGG